LTPHPNPVIEQISKLAADAELRSVHLLAWRDLDDPEAGGSELHAAMVAARWAEAGIDITMRTSFAPNRPGLGRRDGYRIIRKAGRYLVFPRAIASEIVGRMGPRDGLVEIWNGVPFLSPLWARGPRIVFLHHVHGEMWHQVLPPRLAKLGEALELRIAPPLYRRTPVVTLSASSRDEIIHRLGLRPDLVHVAPPGIAPAFSPGDGRAPTPLALFVGRLVPAKRLDVLVDALITVKARVPELQVVLAGEGYERPALEDRLRTLDAAGWITVKGYVHLDELVSLYRQAWVVTSASGHEGWGMTITEAAACGTPAVVSDIAGHRDAVDPGRTGLLAATPAELADGLVRVLTDTALRDRLGAAALARAGGLTWDATALHTFEVLAAEARARR